MTHRRVRGDQIAGRYQAPDEKTVQVVLDRLDPRALARGGLFGEPGQAGAHAHLSGTVLTARRSICALTGQPFTIASVRTAGFEADLCLAGREHPGVPAPGKIVSGTVFLSAAIDGPALQRA